MTEQHPIAPPPDKIHNWLQLTKTGHNIEQIIALAVQWGADQELEACCAELRKNVLNGAIYVGNESCPSWHHFALKVIGKLRAARRPRPRSLKEQALAQLDHLHERAFKRNFAGFQTDSIRRALEALPDD